MEGFNLGENGPSFEDVDDTTLTVLCCRHDPEERIAGPKIRAVC